MIAERIGWTRGMTVLRDRIAELRPLFLPPDPSQRTWYRPGELAQFDLWQPDVEIPVGFELECLLLALSRRPLLHGCTTGLPTMSTSLDARCSVSSHTRCGVWVRADFFEPLILQLFTKVAHEAREAVGVRIVGRRCG